MERELDALAQRLAEPLDDDEMAAVLDEYNAGLTGSTSSWRLTCRRMSMRLSRRSASAAFASNGSAS